MTDRSFPIALAVAVAIYGLICGVAAKNTHDDPVGPNVAIVILDDISNEYVGCYGEGPPEDQPPTPVLDQLAAQGVRFTRCYANPLCSPTRATILTGCYAYRLGIGDAIKEWETTHLDFSQESLPRLAQTAGYSTALVGKWHLGDVTAPDFFDPVIHGFDAACGTRRSIDNYYNWTRYTAYAWHSESEESHVYATTQTTNDAIAFVRSAQEPWFMVVGYHAPHVPWHWPPPPLHSYDPSGPSSDRYLAMIEALDHELGRLAARIDFDDTYLLVVGDNGSVGSRSYPPQHGKGTLYEGGVNVPLIVCGPEVCSGVSFALINTTDLAATAAELMSVLPSATALNVSPSIFSSDGISFAAALSDPDWSGREWVYSERFTDWPTDPPFDQRMAGEERYKLIADRLTGDELLFDLATAPAGQDGDPLNLGQLTPQEQLALDRLRLIVENPE